MVATATSDVKTAVMANLYPIFKTVFRLPSRDIIKDFKEKHKTSKWETMGIFSYALDSLIPEVAREI